MKEITIVILAWNRWDLTKKCVETLLDTHLDGAKILVVDNGSTDLTKEQLPSFAAEKGISYIRFKNNLGFSKGNIRALDFVDSEDDLVLVNNDVYFEEPSWLRFLRATAYTDSRVGIVSPVLLTPEKRLLHAGTYILPDTIWGQQIGSGEKYIYQYLMPREVEGVVFACVYVKRTVIDKIGFLSPEYHSYFEDTDYCIRARKAGFKVVVDGRSVVIHDEHGSTYDISSYRKRLFRESQKIFSKKWKRYLEKSYKYDVVFHTILNFPGGYAQTARKILPNLDMKGVKVIYRYAYGSGTPFPLNEPNQMNDYYLNVLASRDDRKAKVSVVYAQGDVFFKASKGKKVGFTMLEVDGFPKEWVRQANEMDEIWVPSQFNLEGFLNSGLKKQIYKIPLGVDTNYFNPYIKSVPNTSEFVFLSVFEWGERKNPWTLLSTFNQTFSSKEPVRLVAKINNRDPSIKVLEEIRKLRLRDSGGRIYFIFNRNFPYYQMPLLYRSCDCYVSASRGEGWDMPLMEAMACGKPVIAPLWGGVTEYLNEQVGYPVKVKGTVPAVAKCPYYKGFNWADPDSEHLSFLLREVYENREEAARKGANAAKLVAHKYSVEKTVDRIIARLQALLD